MKIGIMGGTFDPIHIGHLILGEFAHEDFGLDEIWFLPNGNPPHKEGSYTEMTFHHRIAMIESAIQDIPYFKLNLMESDTGCHSYTYQTMKRLNQLHPNHSFYFILGADSLFEIEKWKNYTEIFPTCIILAAMRDEKRSMEMEEQIQYLENRYGARIRFLNAPLIRISSSMIRERLKQCLSVRYMVPDAVLDYIKEKRLYGVKNDE